MFQNFDNYQYTNHVFVSSFRSANQLRPILSWDDSYQVSAGPRRTNSRTSHFSLKIDVHVLVRQKIESWRLSLRFLTSANDCPVLYRLDAWPKKYRTSVPEIGTVKVNDSNPKNRINHECSTWNDFNLYLSASQTKSVFYLTLKIF